MLPDEETDLTVRHLQSLRAAVIDASSLIYAENAGFISRVATSIQISTVPGVVAEVGHAIHNVHVIDSADAGLPVDRQVVATAIRDGVAVISDDRDVLAHATGEGLECYNALDMLELALLRGRITLLEWDACHKRLLALASYHPRTVHAGQELHWAVRKRVG